METLPPHNGSKAVRARLNFTSTDDTLTVNQRATFTSTNLAIFS